MTESYIATQPIPQFDLWQKKRNKNALFSFTLELTARCNNNCRHCYINLPENDRQARAEELSFAEIAAIVDQAVELGAVWCLITGGEPLLRDDFFDIYLYLKRKGLLVSVFTNGTLLTMEHVELFKKYPPRDLEITVYGITAQTYGAVTRRPDLFPAFMRGVELLLDNGIRVNLKNVTIKTNLCEFQQIAEFCRKRSSAPFRFDPFIHLRFDRNESKNCDIRKQRLSPAEIATLERLDLTRYAVLEKNCDRYILPAHVVAPKNPFVFGCGIGISDFVVSYNGWYRLCSSFWHKEYMWDLRNNTIKKAREVLVTQVRSLRSINSEFAQNCALCSIINLCMWCPAQAFLESGYLDQPCKYYCEVAKERQAVLCSHQKIS